MLEGEFSRKLLAALRKHPALAKAVIWKHSDRFTSAILDFSVSIGPRTHWFELKIHPNRPTKLQAYYLKRLGKGGHLVTVEKDLVWVMLDEDSVAGDTFDWLVSEIVKLCVNP